MTETLRWIFLFRGIDFQFGSYLGSDFHTMVKKLKVFFLWSFVKHFSSLSYRTFLSKYAYDDRGTLSINQIPALRKQSPASEIIDSKKFTGMRFFWFQFGFATMVSFQALSLNSNSVTGCLTQTSCLRLGWSAQQVWARASVIIRIILDQKQPKHGRLNNSEYFSYSICPKKNNRLEVICDASFWSFLSILISMGPVKICDSISFFSG